MGITSKVQFEPHWKEELVCSMEGKSFVIEFTMGIQTAYLPTQSKWEASVPEWARHQWERVRDDLSDWCKQQKIPLVIEDRAWVYFE